MSTSPHYPIVRFLVASTLHVPVELVTPESSHDNLGGWDSLANVGLVARVAEEFEIDFSLDEIQAATSVEAILAVLDRKLPTAL